MAELETTHWWFVGSRRILLDLLDSHGPDGGNLLDVGCGTGYTLSLLSKSADRWKLHGLDVSQEALRFTNTRCHASLVRGIAGNLAFDDGTFQVVTALDVLEHLEDDHLAAGEIARVLAPGGIALCSVPAHPWLFSTHDVALGHFRRYRKQEFSDLFTGVGLKVEKLVSYNFWLSPIVASIRLAGKAFSRLPVAAGRPDVADDMGQGFQSDLRPLPRALNGILTALFSSESRFVSGSGLPFGISFVAVARKPVG